METRANYILVGSFVLLGFLTIIIFLMWLSKPHFGEAFNIYDIYVKGSVTGLKNGAVVQYRGVPIGNVKSIKINPNDLEIIRVRVTVHKKIYLREGVTASLETQGLTGIAFVQLKGGANENPPLTVRPGEKYPVIPAKASLLEEVASSVPEILRQMAQLTRQFQDILSDESRDSLQKSIKNIEDITNYLSPKNKKDDVLVEVKHAARSLKEAMNEFKSMIRENRQSIRKLSTNGLNSLTDFLHEGRDAMASIKRVGKSLEHSPSRFLYNDPKQGIHVR